MPAAHVSVCDLAFESAVLSGEQQPGSTVAGLPLMQLTGGHGRLAHGQMALPTQPPRHVRFVPVPCITEKPTAIYTQLSLIP